MNRLEPGLNEVEAFRLELEPDAVDALERWVGGSRGMELVKVLRGGKSGDKVLAVYLEDFLEGRLSKVVLKVGKGGATEDGPRAAWDTAGAFQTHLTQLLAVHPTEGGASFSFQKIGGGDLREWIPFSDGRIDRSIIAARLGAIVESVLSDWGMSSGRDQRDGPEMTVGDFIRRNLGYRIESGKNVHRWAYSNGLLGPKDAKIQFIGEAEPLSNPFWLLSEHSLSDRLLRDVQLGKAHGDLHAGNVLVKAAPRVSGEFVLIDLDRFSKDAPLSRDITRLFLSLLDPEWVRLGDAGRGVLIELLANGTETGDLLPQHVLDTYGKFNYGAREWARQNGRHEEWDDQLRLSLICCALMYTGRLENQKDRSAWWFLRLAAHSTAALLKKWDVALPDAAPRHIRELSLVDNSGPEVAEGNSDSSWEELRKQLAATHFDPTSYGSFVESAASLAETLTRDRPDPVGFPEEVQGYVQKIIRFLDEASRPSTPEREWKTISQRVEHMCKVLAELLTPRV